MDALSNVSYPDPRVALKTGTEPTFVIPTVTVKLVPGKAAFGAERLCDR